MRYGGCRVIYFGALLNVAETYRSISQQRSEKGRTNSAKDIFRIVYIKHGDRLDVTDNTLYIAMVNSTQDENKYHASVPSKRLKTLDGNYKIPKITICFLLGNVLQ